MTTCILSSMGRYLRIPAAAIFLLYAAPGEANAGNAVGPGQGTVFSIPTAAIASDLSAYVWWVDASPDSLAGLGLAMRSTRVGCPTQCLQSSPPPAARAVSVSAISASA
jgi:hypothetical protein